MNADDLIFEHKIINNQSGKISEKLQTVPESNTKETNKPELDNIYNDTNITKDTVKSKYIMSSLCRR